MPAGVPELEPFLGGRTSTSCASAPAATPSWAVRPGERAVVAFRDGERGRASRPVHGADQASNLVAALPAYHALGLPLERAAEGSAAIAFSRWRGEESPLPGGGLLINDA